MFVPKRTKVGEGGVQPRQNKWSCPAQQYVFCETRMRTACCFRPSCSEYLVL